VEFENDPVILISHLCSGEMPNHGLGSALPLSKPARDCQKHDLSNKCRLIHLLWQRGQALYSGEGRRVRSPAYAWTSAG
jgi:hypothetical protein